MAKRGMRLLVAVCVLVSVSTVARAQQTANSASTIVPRLIKFSGTLLDERESAMKGPVGVTFALYTGQSGGAALWMETQNVEPDSNGNYTILLGAASATGVPQELFASGEARWLGIQVESQAEQPRVLLVSVPYALKAVDAETLGGFPPSAFAQARSSVAESSNAVSSSSPLVPLVAASSTSFSSSTDPNVTTPGGTINFLPKFDTPSDVKTSQIFDNGINVGIGFPVTPTPAPVAKLDVNGSANVRGTLQLPATGTANSTTKGFNSQPFDYLASVFNGTAAVNQHFRWQAEPVNPGLGTASGKLNLLFASGTGTPAETGLSINNKGIISFAAGQTLPTVAGNETVSGNVSVGGQLISTVANGTAPLKVTSTTVVPNLNASLLGGLPASAFAKIGTNTFLGPQFIPGGATGMVGIGDVGCGGSFAGIGFGVNGLTGCTNWSLLGDGTNTEIGRPPNGTVIFEKSGSGVVDMQIDSSGNLQINGLVGIGTATPSARLDVTALLHSQDAIRGVGSFSGGAGVVGIGAVAQNLETFGGAGVMATGGSGSSFGFGGTGIVATGGSAAPGLLSGGFGIEATGGTNGDGSLARAGEFHGDVEITGCLGINGLANQGTCQSDVRLKQNIRPYLPVLDKLVRLQPVTYDWRVEEYPQFRFSSQRATGLIAQEVEKVFPDMVSIDAGGYKRVNYGELPYLMLQAIRELKAENDDLRERIQRLEKASASNP